MYKVTRARRTIRRRKVEEDGDQNRPTDNLYGLKCSKLGLGLKMQKPFWIIRPNEKIWMVPVTDLP